MRFHEVNFNKFSLRSFQFANGNEMNSTRDFKLRFFCFLCLCLAFSERGLCQDITPELPEDFPTSTEPTTTTAAATTTTTEEATTREAMITTTTQAATTTTTEATTTTTEASTQLPTTTPSNWYLPPRKPTMRPFYYPYPPYDSPTYAPPSSPPVPAYTPAYHFLWDLDNSGEERCYLKNQVERSYFRWCCHCEYIEQRYMEYHHLKPSFDRFRLPALAELLSLLLLRAQSIRGLQQAAQRTVHCPQHRQQL